jgi:hypothetical protein
VHGDPLLETLVDQGLLDGSAGLLGDLAQQGDAGGVVVRVRGRDDHRDDWRCGSVRSRQVGPDPGTFGRPAVEVLDALGVGLERGEVVRRVVALGRER